MREGIRYNYFVIVRIVIMFIFGTGGFLNIYKDKKVGVLALILLLVSLLVACICLMEFFEKKNKLIMLIVSTLLV